MSGHIEALPVPDIPPPLVGEGERPEVELVEQPHGGALMRGGAPNRSHGLGFRGSQGPGPTILERAAEIQQSLLTNFGDKIAGLDLPTIGVLCQTWAEADMYHAVVMEYADGRRSRTVNKRRVTGIEACPAWIAQEATRKQTAVTKMLQDLGLDLTGMVRVLKDDAIRRNLDGDPLKSLGARGRKLRELRGRSSA